jgi:hypothetical protein
VVSLVVDYAQRIRLRIRSSICAFIHSCRKGLGSRAIHVSNGMGERNVVGVTSTNLSHPQMMLIWSEMSVNMVTNIHAFLNRGPLATMKSAERRLLFFTVSTSPTSQPTTSKWNLILRRQFFLLLYCLRRFLSLNRRSVTRLIGSALQPQFPNRVRALQLNLPC